MLPEFFYFLDRNLEDVEGFYNKKYADAARRLKLLQDRYGKYERSIGTISKDEVEDIMEVLLELRSQLKHLQWYGEVNRRGFVKITKKLDKKIDQQATQKRYLETKVDPKQFATNTQLLGIRNVVNDWIAKLTEASNRDDASSTHSSHSLRRVLSQVMASMPIQVLDRMELAVRKDDVEALRYELSKLTSQDEKLDSESFRTIICQSLLQRAITHRSKSCIGELLSRLPTLNESDDINGRNCIHRLIILASRSQSDIDQDTSVSEGDGSFSDEWHYIKPAAPPILMSRRPARQETNDDLEKEKDKQTVDVLQCLLGNLQLHQQSAIQAQDTYGRLPLHYAAQYGLVTVCRILVSHMRKWGYLEGTDGVNAPFWPDIDGYVPLHLSVIGGHPLTTQLLLEVDGLHTETRKLAFHKSMARSGEVLALAVKANYVPIVRLLVDAGLDVNYQDDQGETALHVAARFGSTDCADILLSGHGSIQADMEVTEYSYGWTPLLVASVDGHLGVVKTLIASGANISKIDSSGWSAKEHAALRGHLEITRLLASLTPSDAIADSQTLANGSGQQRSLTDRKSTPTANGNTGPALKNAEPVKSFGHRYLTSAAMILVSLGTMDTRKVVEAVNLDHIPLADAHSTQLDTALSVIVSAQGATGEPSIIDLPIQDNISTEPTVFHAADPASVRLRFDIVPTYAGSSSHIVGRGAALLSSVKPSLGSKRISLHGDLSIPIMATTTMEIIGTVNFNFLVITPFSHSNLSLTKDQMYWKKMASTMLIGHRGLGKNVAGRSSLQLGENTIQSFIAAANLGASYVEFDVQLTKDLVPVIYHDFLVSETGIDAPVHTLTLEQFLHVNNNKPSQKGSQDHVSGPSGDSILQNTNGFTSGRQHRSMSLSDAVHDDTSDSMSERMKNTRDYKAKGFKANTRGRFIQGAFTTLDEMFEKLPESTGFNIEMKYPMLYESEEQEMDTYAVELNSFVDAVLAKVFDWGGPAKRNIIFSSFNPDVCLLLSFKQPSIPVLFLTDAGTSAAGDIRATSLQEAIRFASHWNLLGVVSAAEPLVLSPRLVKVVKESGLVCVSYGTLNNDPESVHVSPFLARHARPLHFFTC